MGMRVLGRLQPGISAQRAQSELDSIAAGLASEYPKDNKDHGIHTVSLREDLVGNVRTPLLALLGAVGFVLLIACANVANLVLARSTARQREFAIRGALGATPGRLVRQLLTEGLLLALVGGILGLLVAVSLNALFVARLSGQLPRTEQINLDASVLGFTALISILASLLFGIAPALQSSRSDINETLKESGRGTSGRHGFQRALVVVEVALALVLTASAGLMVRTMSKLWGINPGFDPQNVLYFEIAGSPAVHGTPQAVRNGFTQTMDRLRSVPGVQAVSLIFGSAPMNGDSELWYWVEGRPKPAERSDMDLALFYGVDPDYFKAMRIQLLRGRLLTAQDDEKSSCVVNVDEELARKAFPKQDPLGQHINIELINLKCEVVGLVGHVKHWGLDADATSKVHSQMYLPFRQVPDSVMDLASTGGAGFVARTAGDPYALAPPLKQAVTSINATMVMYGARSMTDVIKDSLTSRRLTRLLLGLFAALALILAALGIYGVVSYTVTQSTHDIGVRMALGAGRRAVMAMVLGSAMRMAVIGIVIGAAIAFPATRAIRGLLFGVSAADPLTFGAVALALVLVMLLASYIPAWRATKVDPVTALRHE
jgi:predicted permease